MPIAACLKQAGWRTLLLEDLRSESLDIPNSFSSGLALNDATWSKGNYFSRGLRFFVQVLARFFPQISTFHALLDSSIRMDQLLSATKPDALLFYSDGIRPWQTFLSAIGIRSGTATFVVPHSFGPPPFVSAIARFLSNDKNSNGEIKSLQRQVLAKVFSKWTVEAFGRRVFGWSPMESFASMLLRFQPVNPVSRCGGYSHWVLAPSEIEAANYIAEGVDPKKIRVLGSPVFDRSWQAANNGYRASVSKDLHLRKDSRIALLNFSPSSDFGLSSEEEEKETLESLLQTISEFPAWQVIISMHPGPEPRFLRPLAKKFCTPIAEGGVVELLTVTDLYVSPRSTTIASSLGLGIPTVMLLFQELWKDPEFLESIKKSYTSTGVLLASNLEEATTGIARLLGLPEEMKAAQHGAKRDSSKWAAMDGRCSERIAKFVISKSTNHLS